MQIGYLKGCKPKFIKQIVMLVCICYLLSPLQNQIVRVLHSISHSIEMPQALLSNDHDSTGIHNQHNHSTTLFEHNHKLINLVNSVFEASNDHKDHEETILNKVKVKKHINSSSIQLPLNYKYTIIKEYFAPIYRLREGFPKTIEFPPITFESSTT